MARTPAVPYCTVKGFRACLDLIRRTSPTHLDRDLLISRGFSQHAAYPVLGAFRFLGLLDDEGRILPTVQCFLDDDLPNRRKLVEDAYREVLADVTMPVEDREVVDRLLIEQHGVAPGVAPFCATFMLWIAAEAGMPVADLGRSRRGRPPAHLVLLSASARQAIELATAMRRSADMPQPGRAAGAHLPVEEPRIAAPPPPPAAHAAE